MKIGYVMERFPRGSHDFLLDEVVQLEARGVEVHVFSLRMADGRIDDTAAALARLQRPVRYFPAAAEVEATHLRSSETKWIAGQTIERGLEHLHAHGAAVAADVARDAARLTGLGYSFTAHAEGLFGDADMSSICETVREARFVVTLNEFDRRHLLRLCGAWAGARLQCVAMGVTPDDHRFSGPDCRDADSVLAIGPLVEKSGFADLIESLAILRHRGRVARLTIVGEGALEGELRAQIQRSRLDGCVQLLGGLSRDQLAMMMRTHTALVLPWVASHRDRDVLVNVVLEAMAAGLVVLATDVPGIQEFIDDGLSGRVINPRDRTWLAGALETLFDSPELREGLAARARSKVVRLFSAPRNAELLTGLFTRATAAQGLAS